MGSPIGTYRHRPSQSRKSLKKYQTTLKFLSIKALIFLCLGHQQIRLAMREWIGNALKILPLIVKYVNCIGNG